MADEIQEDPVYANFIEDEKTLNDAKILEKTFLTMCKNVGEMSGAILEWTPDLDYASIFYNRDVDITDKLGKIYKGYVKLVSFKREEVIPYIYFKQLPSTLSNLRKAILSLNNVKEYNAQISSLLAERQSNKGKINNIEIELLKLDGITYEDDTWVSNENNWKPAIPKGDLNNLE